MDLFAPILLRGWIGGGGGGGGGGTVTSVTSADTSIGVTSSTTTPLLQLATPDVIFTNEKPASSVPMNGQRITGLGAGVAATDAANVSQVPNIKILGQSGTAATHTGDTSESILATIAVPANTILANGMVVIYTVWQQTGAGATAPTLRVRFGASGSGLSGSILASIGATATTTLAGFQIFNFANAGATNSQIGTGNSSTTLDIFNSNGSILTSAIDTTAATELNITGQLGTSGNTIALKNYLIVCYPHS